VRGRDGWEDAYMKTSPTFEDLRDNIIGAIEATSRTVSAVSRYQDGQTAEIERLWADNAALRDELHAVSNRVEALTRALAADHAA
jgi:ABC-type transporter Mla subunit MlaD